jgi:hypothetical protein
MAPILLLIWVTCLSIGELILFELMAPILLLIWVTCLSIGELILFELMD